MSGYHCIVQCFAMAHAIVLNDKEKKRWRIFCLSASQKLPADYEAEFLRHKKHLFEINHNIVWTWTPNLPTIVRVLQIKKTQQNPWYVKRQITIKSFDLYYYTLSWILVEHNLWEAHSRRKGQKKEQTSKHVKVSDVTIRWL